MRAHFLRQGAPIVPIATKATTTVTNITAPSKTTPRGRFRERRALGDPQRRSVVCATPSSGAAAAAAAAAPSVSSAAAAGAAATAPPLSPSSLLASSPSSPSSSPASPPAPSPSPRAAAPPETEVPPFSWTAQWDPVSFVEDLDRSQPNAFTLLGVKLAFYYEEENARWVALEDSCPHRRAPLSQGRLLLTETKDAATGKKRTTETRLECSYHGWVFGGAEGKCARIPQLEGCSSLVSRGAAAAATASPRACATPRPCRVAQGMLWVWGEGPKFSAAKARAAAAAAGRKGPEEGEGGGEEKEDEDVDPVARMFREAAETEPIYAPGISIEDPDVPSDAAAPAAAAASASGTSGNGGGKSKKPEKLLTLAGRYYRDVEYDATTLIDNLLDASHLAFAHNRVLGDRDAEDAGDVAAARVSLDAESGEEVETAALAAVLSSTPHKREKRERGGGGGGGGGEGDDGEEEHRYLDRHSAAARALRTELLTGDAAVFDSAFRVPRTDKDGRMLTRILFEPPALATWFCDKPDGDPVCAGSRWRVSFFFLFFSRLFFLCGSLLVFPPPFFSV